MILIKSVRIHINLVTIKLCYIIINSNKIWVTFWKGERGRVVVGRLYLRSVFILQVVGIIFAWERVVWTYVRGVLTLDNLRHAFTHSKPCNQIGKN